MRYADSAVIAPQTIDRIRDSADLGSIVGESVKLERRGRSLIGLCPFHKEKSPSFNVNEDRGFYHCFGCKASGDVFKFVQETEGLTFIEAVRSLGERLGIEVEDDLSSEQRRKRAGEKRREQALFDVSASAASFFEAMLKTHPLARFGQEELDRRELDWKGAHGEVLKSFRLGYAPDSWDELAAHLRSSGHDLRAAENVGLIAPRRQKQGFYDRFRHRLMFAVLDLHGRVIAFSGRSLPPVKASDDDSPAKYINSPESPIYKKRATVFGLYQARSELRSGKSCVLVEGNFDVVSLHARGFCQAVAPLGTAFTTEQGKLIRRFSSDVTFLFDGDKAGRKATSTSRQPAREAGLSAKVARLPLGVDPDDFIRERGSDDLSNLLSASRGMLDYLVADILDENFAAADAAGQAKKVQEVLELLKSEDDPNVSALAEQHADKLAARLGVADAHTFRTLRASVHKNLVTRSEPPDDPRWRDEPADFGQVFEPKTSSARALDRSIFGALLDFPELLDSEEFLAYSTHMEGDLAAAVGCLNSSSFSVEGALPLRAKLHDAISRLPRHMGEFASRRLAAPRHEKLEVARSELRANLDKLRQMELTRISSGTLGEIEQARQEGDFDQELALLKEQELRARQKRGM